MERPDSATLKLRQLVFRGRFELTKHGEEKLLERHISVQEVREALESGVVLENYPEYERGPCCLVAGQTNHGRNLHIVITSRRLPLVVITAYEPSPPKRTSPTERSNR